jgi:hypothetical protein
LSLVLLPLLDLVGALFTQRSIISRISSATWIEAYLRHKKILEALVEAA